MDDDRIKGKARQAFGHLQDAAGGLVGDEGLQARGKLNQGRGNAQDMAGRAKDSISDAVCCTRNYLAEKPFVSMAIGLGLGLILGNLLASEK